MVKLHLGCGEKRIDGFINIDLRQMDSVDVVANIKYLRKIKDGSVDLVYAQSVLEHFIRWEYKSVLRRWCEILKPGGVLRVGVPDFEKIVEHYQEHKDLDILMGLLYGGQDYEHNFHYICWDFKRLKRDLEELGFTNIHKYDWRDTEHAHIDDFGQSYLPHMDKDNGMLMVLNVEATKI